MRARWAKASEVTFVTCQNRSRFEDAFQPGDAGHPLVGEGAVNDQARAAGIGAVGE
jgi:hypothetical protein